MAIVMKNNNKILHSQSTNALPVKSSSSNVQVSDGAGSLEGYETHNGGNRSSLEGNFTGGGSLMNYGTGSIETIRTGDFKGETVLGSESQHTGSATLVSGFVEEEHAENSQTPIPQGTPSNQGGFTRARSVSQGSSVSVFSGSVTTAPALNPPAPPTRVVVGTGGGNNNTAEGLPQQHNMDTNGSGFIVEVFKNYRLHGKPNGDLLSVDDFTTFKEFSHALKDLMKCPLTSRVRVLSYNGLTSGWDVLTNEGDWRDSYNIARVRRLGMKVKVGLAWEGENEDGVFEDEIGTMGKGQRGGRKGKGGNKHMGEQTGLFNQHIPASFGDDPTTVPNHLLLRDEAMERHYKGKKEEWDSVVSERGKRLRRKGGNALERGSLAQGSSIMTTNSLSSLDSPNKSMGIGEKGLVSEYTRMLSGVNTSTRGGTFDIFGIGGGTVDNSGNEGTSEETKARGGKSLLNTVMGAEGRKLKKVPEDVVRMKRSQKKLAKILQDGFVTKKEKNKSTYQTSAVMGGGDYAFGRALEKFGFDYVLGGDEH